MASVKEKRLSETSNNNVEEIINGLEKIKCELIKVVEKYSLNGQIIDEIRTIQCIVDEAIKAGTSGVEPLTERVDKVLDAVNQAIIKISDFHKNYTQSLPNAIFEDLKYILGNCEEQLNNFREKLEFIRISVEDITKISKLGSKLDQNSDKHTFQTWAIALEKFGEGLEDFLNIYPQFKLSEIEKSVGEILLIAVSKSRKENRKEGYRRRLRYAANFIINLIESKKSYLSHEQVYEISEDQDTLVKEFMILSESALNEIWLAPEEDEAWKDLLDT